MEIREAINLEIFLQLYHLTCLSDKPTVIVSQIEALIFSFSSYISRVNL